MEKELCCPVCHEFFVEPVMLRCTHHICKAHLPSTAARERLACPSCGEVTVVPDGGLRVDRPLSLVVEFWGKLSTPPRSKSGAGGLSLQESPGTTALCGFCEEKPATRHCLQCDGVLCNECEKSSHAKGFFRSHQIVDLEEVASQAPDYSSRMRCDEHPEEKLSFYCLDCRKPVCSHCLILGEHKGHSQTPVDQAFQTGKETLSAWMEKLRQGGAATEELLSQLHEAELEVNRGAEAQRNTINQEMDHLRELVETKRHQLLSKSALEEKQKRGQIQGQMDRAEAARQDTVALIGRAEDLLSLTSEHAFLAVVLPLIQDMKRCASQPVDDAPRVSCAFRPLSTDAQARSLGELNFGQPPRALAAAPAPGGSGAAVANIAVVPAASWQQLPATAPPVAANSLPGVGPLLQGGQAAAAEGQHGNFAAMSLGYNLAQAHATVSHIPHISQAHAPQAQFMYRAMPG